MQPCGHTLYETSAKCYIHHIPDRVPLQHVYTFHEKQITPIKKMTKHFANMPRVWIS